jgi:aspartyl-tRNA(Asn)/glutamyl-tRNA(Gln) amidotransferase subunit A
MNDPHPCDLSIAELSALYRSRVLSPVDVTLQVLDRIERIEGRLNAYILVTPERALRDARRAEAELLRGEGVSPLCGIPISLKDIFEVEGLPMTCGSDVLRGRYVSTSNATVARRLFDVGIVLVGKSNMLEFAYGETHPSFGHTRNPWDTERSTMGSSTGSAATVAARQAFASIGTDTGGSIRLPASYCGLVGLKPTYGLVSRSGLVSLSWSCDHVGPLTRTAADAAIVMNAIAGYDPDDPTSDARRTPDFVEALRASVRGYTIGLVTHDFGEQEDPEVRTAVAEAVEILRHLGLAVRDVDLSGVSEAVTALITILLVEASSYHEQWLRERPDGYSTAILERLKLGAFVPGVSYLAAQRYRRIFSAGVAAAFEEVDFLVLPASITPAHRLADEHVGRDLAPLVRSTGPFNLSGHPAVSVPCGFTRSGLPIGMQIVGRHFADHRVLLLAHRYQEATDWHTRRPPITESAAGNT